MQTIRALNSGRDEVDLSRAPAHIFQYQESHDISSHFRKTLLNLCTWSSSSNLFRNWDGFENGFHFETRSDPNRILFRNRGYSGETAFPNKIHFEMRDFIENMANYDETPLNALGRTEVFARASAGSTTLPDHRYYRYRYRHPDTFAEPNLLKSENGRV
jgi:hypothetical protein